MHGRVCTTQDISSVSKNKDLAIHFDLSKIINHVYDMDIELPYYLLFKTNIYLHIVSKRLLPACVQQVSFNQLQYNDINKFHIKYQNSNDKRELRYKFAIPTLSNTYSLSNLCHIVNINNHFIVH